jgi:GNAT superfamily N-acetyltransferase
VSPPGNAAARARAWHHTVQATVCDVLEPWDHGTVVRASRYPMYFDFNAVRVEEHPGMSVDALIAFADEALEGLDHRRVDIEPADVAAALRPDFQRRGWETQRLVWMVHQTSEASGPAAIAVEEVPYEAVHDLRVAWLEEDFQGLDLDSYLTQAHEVANRLHAQVFAAHQGGTPVAFAQLERLGRSAEISLVFVRADHRGRGLGTAITRAAIEAIDDLDELWIVADDEGRPKHLYARLGFNPAWTTVQALRLPRGASAR